MIYWKEKKSRSSIGIMFFTIIEEILVDIFNILVVFETSNLHICGFQTRFVFSTFEKIARMMNIKSDGIFPSSLFFQRSTGLPLNGNVPPATNEFIVLQSAMFSTVFFIERAGKQISVHCSAVSNSTNLISFFFSNSDWSKNQRIKELISTTCHLFVSSNKSQSGRKKRPESRSNESFSSLCNTEAPLIPHIEFLLTVEIRVEIDLIWREECN